MRPMDLGRAGRVIDPHDNVLATSRDPNAGRVDSNIDAFVLEDLAYCG